jgi:hypothetical protein
MRRSPARPPAGRPRLSEKRICELSVLLIENEARQFDFEAALLTTDLVHDITRREFGVSLSWISVSRQLEKPRLAPRRPMQCARKRHQEAMARWQRHELPRIMARAGAAGATMYFADEVRQEPGRSPVPGSPPRAWNHRVRRHGARRHLAVRRVRRGDPDQLRGVPRPPRA